MGFFNSCSLVGHFGGGGVSVCVTGVSLVLVSEALLEQVVRS